MFLVLDTNLCPRFTFHTHLFVTETNVTYCQEIFRPEGKMRGAARRKLIVASLFLIPHFSPAVKLNYANKP